MDVAVGWGYTKTSDKIHEESKQSELVILDIWNGNKEESNNHEKEQQEGETKRELTKNKGSE